MKENVWKKAIAVQSVQALGLPPAALRQPSAADDRAHRGARAVLVCVFKSRECVRRIICRRARRVIRFHDCSASFG